MKRVLAVIFALCLLLGAAAAEELTEAAPEATETPYEVKRITGLFSQVWAQIVVNREGDPVFAGKLVFAVFQNQDDEDPVISFLDDRYVKDVIPEDRLAASLDEADTVVFVWAKYVTVGRYSSGKAADRCDMMVGAFDMHDGGGIYRYYRALTSNPPSVVHDLFSHSGEFKPDEVIRMIAETLDAPAE